MPIFDPKVKKTAPAPASKASSPSPKNRQSSIALPRYLSASKKPKEKFPWIGQIYGTWAAALRKTPFKDPEAPHQNTLADLPKGTFVTVIGRKDGWLHVQATVEDQEYLGYVSQELVLFNRHDFEPMALRDAMVELKRAEMKLQADPNWKPSEEEQEKLDEAIPLLKAEGKYTLDESSYQVGFAPAGAGSRIKVSSIEDFILFVEVVEAQYPGASPAQIVSEIRQLWYSDVNWELLVASEGLQEGAELLDIEMPPNPIAMKFDMSDLAPPSGGKTLNTVIGAVDIGHVMAGIDARLSGFPQEYPEEHLKARGHNTYTSEFKYRVLKEFSGGNATTFTTFAGDLGQAYASFIHDRYDKKDKSAKLWQYLSAMAKPSELLGDIHGYIAVEVAKDMRASEKSPTGSSERISAILRDMYLLNKGDSGTPQVAYMEKVSGKWGGALKAKIMYDSLMFAHPWYAKLVAADSFELWLPGDLFEEYSRDFGELVDKHERSAEAEDTLDGAVDKLLEMAQGRLR